MLKIKNVILFILFLFSARAFSQVAEQMRIVSVEYDIEGKTTEYALSEKVKIDKNRTFYSSEELEKYLDDIKSQIENLRAFETVDVEYEETLADETGSSSNISVIVRTVDSKHLVLLPYPKYSSSEGFSVKIKVKDTNFFGTLEDFSADLSYGAKTKYDGTFDKNEFGAAINYNYPFKLAVFDAMWLNAHKLTWSPGDDSPAWKLNTGLLLSLWFGRLSVVNKFNQKFFRYIDEDIEDYDGRTFIVGKETLFVEEDTLSVPITTLRTENFGNLIVSPFAFFSFAWSPYDSDYEDLLLKKELFGGTNFSFGRVNWIKNLRNGLDVGATAKFGKDFTNDKLVYSVKAEIKGYKAFIFEFEDERSFEFGINFNVLAFYASNTTEYFGERMRGVYDKPYFSTPGFENRKSTVASNFLIASIDVPFKVMRIFWEDLPSFQNISWLRKLDMEIQAGPFTSIALFNNKAADTDMDIKDGFFTTGGEIVIFPLHWKGIQLRASFGYDLSRVIPFFNKDWRSDKYSKYEITIGFGLHY
ncbi:MAG: hypothetical protein IJP61_08670 [Treponema sp.]|nr:hypothetical protein [Treponema sp.]